MGLSRLISSKLPGNTSIFNALHQKRAMFLAVMAVIAERSVSMHSGGKKSIRNSTCRQLPGHD